MSPVEIKNIVGKVVSRSRNLRNLRTHCSQNLIDHVLLIERPTGEGVLVVCFDNGNNAIVDFASFECLKWVVKNWRSMYGTSLFINGRSCGTVSYKNHHLI